MSSSTSRKDFITYLRSLSSFIFEDDERKTSEAFQIYSFGVAIWVLAFGVHLSSSIMALINFWNAAVRLDLGFSSSNIQKLNSKSKLLITLDCLTLLYLAVEKYEGGLEESMIGGFSWSWLSLVLVVMGADQYILYVSLEKHRTIEKQFVTLAE